MNHPGETLRSFIRSYGIDGLGNCQLLIGYVKDICPKEKKFINCLIAACENGYIEPLAHSTKLSDVQKQNLIGSIHTRLMSDIGLSKNTADDFVESLIYGLEWPCFVPNTSDQKIQYNTQTIPTPKVEPKLNQKADNQRQAEKISSPPNQKTSTTSKPPYVLYVLVACVVIALLTYVIPTTNKTMKLGNYEQDNNLSNGMEPIKWIILDEDDESMLLISKYIIDWQPYHNTYDDISWATSDLRNWLNNEFYNQAFSENEQGRIMLTETSSITSDKVFLLSFDELVQYFPMTGQGTHRGTESCSTTEYVRKNYGAYSNTSYWWLLKENNGTGGPTPSDTGSGYYWTIPFSVNSEYGVRPVIRIVKQ